MAVLAAGAATAEELTINCVWQTSIDVLTKENITPSGGVSFVLNFVDISYGDLKGYASGGGCPNSDLFLVNGDVVGLVCKVTSGTLTRTFQYTFGRDFRFVVGGVVKERQGDRTFGPVNSGPCRSNEGAVQR